MQIIILCLEFLRTGLFAVGGGLATLPFLAQMSLDHPTWFSTEMLANMVAVAESTPGPLGVNMATYVGYRVAGLPGAILATLSLALPAVVIIIVISKFLQQYRQNKTLNDVFSTLRPAVAGLIAAAGYSMLTMALTVKADAGISLNWTAIVLFFVLLALIEWKKLKKVHPIAFIGVGAVVGMILGL
jgi:chromate transporter